MSRLSKHYTLPAHGAFGGRFGTGGSTVSTVAPIETAATVSRCFCQNSRGLRRHDLQVTNAHFATAVAERAVQQMTASEGTAPLKAAPFVEYSNDSATCRESFALSVAEAGVEPARELPPTGF